MEAKYTFRVTERNLGIADRIFGVTVTATDLRKAVKKLERHLKSEYYESDVSLAQVKEDYFLGSICTNAGHLEITLLWTLYSLGSRTVIITHNDSGTACHAMSETGLSRTYIYKDLDESLACVKRWLLDGLAPSFSDVSRFQPTI